jgi:hypothetical protein
MPPAADAGPLRVACFVAALPGVVQLSFVFWFFPGRLALRRGDLSVDLGLLSALGLLRALERRVDTQPALELALLRRPLAFVR